MSNIIPLPAEIMARKNLRSRQQALDRLNAILDVGDPGTSAPLKDRVAYVTAESIIGDVLEELRAAEAEVAMLDADDAMCYKGMVYRATASFAGAH